MICCFSCKKLLPPEAFQPSVLRNGGTTCAVCARVYCKKYYAEKRGQTPYKDAFNKRRRERYATPEGAARVKETNRRWREENAAKVKALKHDYYLRNKDTIGQKTRSYAINNRERINAGHRRWAKTHPEYVRAIGRIQRSRRRARLKGKKEHYTLAQWVELVKKMGYKCLRCWCPGTAKNLQPDHVISLAAGGADTIDNIQPLCKGCNVRKHSNCVDYRYDRFTPMFREAK